MFFLPYQETKTGLMSFLRSWKIALGFVPKFIYSKRRRWRLSKHSKQLFLLMKVPFNKTWLHNFLWMRTRFFLNTREGRRMQKRSHKTAEVLTLFQEMFFFFAVFYTLFIHNVKSIEDLNWYLKWNFLKENMVCQFQSDRCNKEHS